MSGIVGLFLREGGQARRPEVRRMLNAIPHRGCDTVRICCKGPVGFGNRLMWTTPESLVEDLPRSSPSGVHMIAADARIDNRDDLISTLRIVRDSGPVTDSELILRAYEKWKEGCAEQLIGDFSFAIWDSLEQQLFCARDSAGTRCFYYYDSPKLFAFASEIKALAALREVPCALNEQRVGDFLNHHFEDRASTFYQGIFRLPPASSMVANAGGLLIRRYWQLDPHREIKLRDDREYTEAFREKFDEAVRCRLRNAFSTGSSLSGGLDSSSIACTARNILSSRPGAPKLHTFSIVFPGLPEQDLRLIDERRYIECVLAGGNFEPHYVCGDTLNPLQDCRRIHYHLEEANFAPNLYLHWAMYEAARNAGVRVFLDGLDGDTTVSHGFEYLEELLRRLRWRELYRQGSLLAANLLRGSKTRRVIWKYCLRDVAPAWARGAWSAVRRHGSQESAGGAFTHPHFLKHWAERRKTSGSAGAAHPRTARQHHASVLDLPLYGNMLEAADKATAAFGIEARYPFFDRRLIEFCVALPATQKLADGWNRAVFRRAMEGVLPAEIQWRRTKGNLSPNFRRGMLQSTDIFNRIVSTDDGVFGRYLDLGAIRETLRPSGETPGPARPQNLLGLFMAANLALWLEQTRLEPAGTALG